MKNAKVTISRPQYGDGRERMSITICDADSRVQLIELEMQLDDFTRAITGRGESPAVVTQFTKEDHYGKFGKILKTRRVECDRVSYDKDVQKNEVIRHFNKNHLPDGWEISSTGIDTQQHGEKHTYVIRRWLTPEEYKKEQEDFVL